MKVSRLLFLRLIAGGVGFFPSLTAAIFLDARQYGLGATSFALAMMIVGPVAQYASQGYMRALLLPDRAQIPASHIVMVFMSIVGMVMAGLAGTGFASPTGALIFALAVLSILFTKLEEVRQIAHERQMTSVLLFYILPPSITSASFVVSALMRWPLRWQAIAIIMALAYMTPALLSLMLRGSRPLAGAMTIDRRQIRLLWLESRTFLFSGIISSATENMPTLALTLLGAPQRVATFEVVRKLSSAISVFLHGLAIAYSPRIITAAANNDMPMVVKIIRQNGRLSALFALIYIPSAIVGVVVMGMLGWKTLVIPVALATPLFLSAMVTCAASPFGLAVTALHQERWWVIGGGIGFATFCLTLSLTQMLGVMETVALAVLFQNTALSVTITLVVRRMIRQRLHATT